MSSTVIYDADCGLCTTIKRWIERLDHFQTMHWVPIHEAGGFGIPQEEMMRAVQLITRRGRTAGFSAFKRILVRLPLTWLLIAILVWISAWSLLAIVLLFSPVSNPLGNRAYDWVARRRHCKLTFNG